MSNGNSLVTRVVSGEDELMLKEGLKTQKTRKFPACDRWSEFLRPGFSRIGSFLTSGNYPACLNTPAKPQLCYCFNAPDTIGRSLTLSPSWQRINGVEVLLRFTIGC